jgi:hypothetical protein
MKFKTLMDAVGSVGGLFASLEVILLAVCGAITHKLYKQSIIDKLKLSKKYENMENAELVGELESRLSSVQLFKIYDIIH